VLSGGGARPNNSFKPKTNRCAIVFGLIQALGLMTSPLLPIVILVLAATFAVWLRRLIELKTGRSRDKPALLYVFTWGSVAVLSSIFIRPLPLDFWWRVVITGCAAPLSLCGGLVVHRCRSHQRLQAIPYSFVRRCRHRRPVSLLRHTVGSDTGSVAPHRALTIHSSRSRFAARLNSGVRPL